MATLPPKKVDTPTPALVDQYGRATSIVIDGETPARRPIQDLQYKLPPEGEEETKARARWRKTRDEGLSHHARRDTLRREVRLIREAHAEVRIERERLRDEPMQAEQRTVLLAELDEVAIEVERRMAVVPKLEARAEVYRQKAAESERQASAQLQTWAWLYRERFVIPPFVDPDKAHDVVLGSDALSCCIGALAENVGTHGHELEAIVSGEAEAEIKDETKKEIEVERLQLERFFRFCNRKLPFVEIYKRTTSDEEVTAYAAWEFIRNGAGKLVGIEHMPARTVRWGAPSSEMIAAKIPVQDEKGQWTYETQPVYFRLIVQQLYGRFRWFKEFGDPRTIDSETGEVVTDETRAQEMQESGRAAREAWIFEHYGVSGGIGYGIPPWLGAVDPALGRSAAGASTLYYFDNNAIPDCVVMISGATLHGGGYQAVKDHFSKVKGRKNQRGAVLVLEAVPPVSNNLDPSGRGAIHMDIKELGSHDKDGHFMGYRKEALNDVRRMWRLPPLFTGDTSDYTRAAVAEAREVGEQQVFQPRRTPIDFFFNQVLFPAMEINFWRFKTKAAAIVNEEALVALLTIAIDRCIITVEEARAIVARLLDAKLKPYGTAWAKEPWAILAAKAQQGVNFADETAPQDFAPKTPAFPGAPAKPPAAPSADAAGVEAGQADGAAADTAREEPRFFRVKLPADVLAAAQVIDGVIHLRDEVQAELARRVAEEMAKPAPTA